MINKEASPGDLVVYCPDQLGPGGHRLLHVTGCQQATFPRGIAPDRVDWVDYRQVIADTSVDQFGQEMIVRAGWPRHLVRVAGRLPRPGHHCTQLLQLVQVAADRSTSELVANINSGYLRARGAGPLRRDDRPEYRRSS